VRFYAARGPNLVRTRTKSVLACRFTSLNRRVLTLDQASIDSESQDTAVENHRAGMLSAGRCVEGLPSQRCVLRLGKLFIDKRRVCKMLALFRLTRAQ
jgi:hypothetical protein